MCIVILITIWKEIAVLTVVDLSGPDNTEENNSMQNPLISEVCILQIRWCGWEFVFLQNLCRTRGSLDQMLIVLSQNSLDWALNSTCMCASLHEELFASSCTSGSYFLVFLVTLESGTTVAHLLFRSILNVNVKVECA